MMRDDGVDEPVRQPSGTSMAVMSQETAAATRASSVAGGPVNDTVPERQSTWQAPVREGSADRSIPTVFNAVGLWG